MKPGEANIARAQVTLPKSEFLDNEHIGTVCTRVQFRANQCPPDSIYGQARAYTPILDQPIEGPVYLRSNPEHALPDLVAALKGQQIEIDLAGRVDSVGEGRIRNTFEAVPDAPVSKFVLEMAGGDKGLLENSANLCAKHSGQRSGSPAKTARRHESFPALKAEQLSRKGGKRHKQARLAMRASRLRRGRSRPGGVRGLSSRPPAVIQDGNVRVTLLSQVQPHLLPRQEKAPIAVFLSGHVHTVKKGGVPPQLQEPDRQRQQARQHCTTASRSDDPVPTGDDRTGNRELR